jgi:hypothetical protein
MYDTGMGVHVKKRAKPRYRVVSSEVPPGGRRPPCDTLRRLNTNAGRVSLAASRPVDPGPLSAHCSTFLVGSHVVTQQEMSHGWGSVARGRTRRGGCPACRDSGFGRADALVRPSETCFHGFFNTPLGNSLRLSCLPMKAGDSGMTGQRFYLQTDFVVLFLPCLPRPRSVNCLGGRERLRLAEERWRF